MILKKYKKYFIAPLITALMVLLVFLIKGIYPFGNMTIANGDMGQSYMTFYYFLYDICHGTKSLFFDYTLGMGSNMYGGFMIDGLLNPTSYIILLNSRENIPYMFSFVIILKFAFIALTSYILFEKINKKSDYYNCLFSVLYALSAYSLTYNTNLMWLDVVGLFPLFILATKHMFDKGKVIYFAIVLALMLIFNYNLAYMILMFIIFVLPIYIHFGIEKQNRKRAVFNLIWGVLLSVGLSAFAFIPSLVQVMSSYRMSGAVSNTVTNANIMYKIVIFLFYALPLFFYIKWYMHSKKDQQQFKIYTLALLFSAIIPIFFERVNLWWHTGSYQQFPFRYGFIPLLIIYMGALRYVNLFKTNSEVSKLKSPHFIGIVLLLVVLIVFSIYNAIYINTHMPALNISKISFSLITIIFVFSIVIINFILKLKNIKYEYIFMSVLSFVLVLSYGYAYLGVSPEYRYGSEWSDDGVFYANKINKKLDSELYRLKDLAGYTYENSPLVSNIPSMSTFLHLISKEQVLNAVQLGYSSNNTKLNDFGGTLFTDALYGIKYVLTSKKLSDKLYTKIDSIDENYLYQYNNTLPYGILYDEDIKVIPEEYYAFTANNYLYKNLFGKTEDIIEIDKIEVEKNTKQEIYTLDIVGEKELYLYIKDNINVKIKVNGQNVIVPNLNNKDNDLYPTVYNNGILDLGYFEDEQVEIVLTMDTYDNDSTSIIEIGLLDIEKYESIFNVSHDISVSVDRNRINIKGQCEKDTNILLPIVYNDGVESDSEIKQVYNTFIGVSLKKGDNDIVIDFKSPLFKPCLIVTIVTFVLMLVLHIVGLKYNIKGNKVVLNIFYVLGIIIYGGFLIKFYVISILETFLSFLS